MARILVVEDDNNLRETLFEWLSHEEHSVETAATGLDGYELFLKNPFDLVVLDWEVPGLAGIEVCQRIRSKKFDVPIIFLTGRSGISDKEAGFGAGANDYLTKPFHMKELSLRVGALLRRSASACGDVLRAGGLSLDRQSRQVMRNGETIHLTKIEFNLLEEFLAHPGKLITSASLLEKFWPAGGERSAESLRTCLKKLREKIDVEGQASIIKNIHGVGYKLEP